MKMEVTKMTKQGCCTIVDFFPMHVYHVLLLLSPWRKKRRPQSPSPPSTRKKAALKFSSKWRDERDEQANPTVLSPKAFLRRPNAGSQVPYCPLEKIMSDCWSPIEPSIFKVQGQNYLG